MDEVCPYVRGNEVGRVCGSQTQSIFDKLRFAAQLVLRKGSGPTAVPVDPLARAVAEVITLADS